MVQHKTQKSRSRREARQNIHQNNSRIGVAAKFGGPTFGGPTFGGPAPEDNPRLRAAMDKALSANMKKDTIEKAIARGAGNDEADNYEEIQYEGYGPGGVAVMVETMTDNRNRTVAEVRHNFSKFGGNLGTDGSVAYLFEKKGQLFIANATEEAVMELAIEAGADDVQEDEEGVLVEATPDAFLDVKQALTEKGFDIVEATVTMVPATKVDVESEQAETIIKLIDMLEDSDDVQNVYHNAEIDYSSVTS